MTKVKPIKKIFEKFPWAIRFWLPPAIWGTIIFSFSAYPSIQTSPVYWKDFVAKKTAHIIEYAILGILIYRAFRGSGMDKKKAALYSFLISFIYGATDEFHQVFTPTRTPRIRDVIIDTIGAGIGISFVWKLLPILPPKLRNLAEKLQLN